MLLGYKDRAELAGGEYVSIASVIEGTVIVKKAPEEEEAASIAGGGGSVAGSKP